MNTFREHMSKVFVLMAIFAYIAGDTLGAVLLMTTAIYAEIMNM